MIDIANIRRRCCNAIRNTAMGKHLGEALDELQMMRDREATMKAGRAVSSNLIEIAAEQRDPAKWAALMLSKGGNPATSVGDAMDLVEGTLRHALELMLREQCRRCTKADEKGGSNEDDDQGI